VLSGTSAINGTGNALNNTLAGNSGNNILDGGAGSATVTYANYNSYTGITVDLSLTTAQSLNGQDTLLNIENCIGTIYNDTLRGNSSANVLEGNVGNDTLTGRMGNDTFVFAISGNGIDTITDFSSGDRIIVTGATLSGTIAAGNGSAVLTNQVQYAVAGGTTTLYIGTDSTAGADVQINLTGSLFSLDAGQIFSSSVTNSASAAHDYSGDGKSDILLQQTSSLLATWMMNGASIASGPMVGSKPTGYIGNASCSEKV